ncbi:hypothetical protein CUMW_277610 [Citrus unshiu]|uniref:Uncharacterized protein n=1 Tax=Citrus unshiu TaxID=55188 RepID=A0A2H5N4Q0_CITUN|nr:hypothetical protein CUMW_277610 [Citrus unshiu]
MVPLLMRMGWDKEKIKIFLRQESDQRWKKRQSGNDQLVVRRQNLSHTKSESAADLNTGETTANLQASPGVVREIMCEMHSTGRAFVISILLVLFTH